MPLSQKLVGALVCAAATFGFVVPAEAATAPKSDFFVKSVLSVDTTSHTATFPLHRGSAHGKSVWYIVTDASDAGVATHRGVVYAPNLAQLGAAAIAIARPADVKGGVEFAGSPDFSPARTYVAGPTGFPPASAQPGGVADDAYSPFVRITGLPGVLNAPIVATGDGPLDVTTHTNTEDRVIAIDPVKMTVTLALARGFAGGKPVYYLSTEASDPVAASVERATYVPRLAKADSAGTIPIGVVANGALDGDNAQGLAYLALRTPLGQDATQANAATIGSPFNLLSLVPNLQKPFAANEYSPLWSVEAGVWTDAAIAANKRVKLKEFGALALAVANGSMTGPGGKPFGPAGFVVNCPAIAFGDASGTGY